MKSAFGVRSAHKVKTGAGHGAGLNLTPMVDMMTIILVFLIKSYSATPQYLTSTQDIQLSATISEDAAPDAPVLIIGKDGILVEGKVIVPFKNAKPSAELLKKQTVPELLKALTEMKGKAKTQYSQTLILQADKGVSYDALKPVLRMAGAAGFNDIKFAGRSDN